MRKIGRIFELSWETEDEEGFMLIVIDPMAYLGRGEQRQTDYEGWE